MKSRRLALTLLLMAAAGYACSPAEEGGGDAGAPEAAAPAGDSSSPSPADALPPLDATAPDGSRPDASGDASIPDTSTPDAADASVPDASVPDAADGSVADAADAADAAVPPVVTSLVDNVVDYDVNATHVFYRTASGYYSCQLPACTNVQTVTTLVTGYPYLAASNDKFYFFAPAAFNQFTLRSRTTAGGLVVAEDTITWSGAVLPQSLFAGATYLETTYRLNPFVMGAPTYRTLRHPYVTERTPAVGTRHENFGSSVSLGTNLMAPTGTGGPFPTLPTAGTSIGASPVGPTVTHPTVVVSRDGNLEACPTTAACAAWINLGALGTVFNLDATHLYVGGATGLGRCALSEIAATGTCTLTSLVAEPIAPPLYLTPTHAFYRSGTTVKSVTK